jgi:hypothetical protein
MLFVTNSDQRMHHPTVMTVRSTFAAVSTDFAAQLQTSVVQDVSQAALQSMSRECFRNFVIKIERENKCWCSLLKYAQSVAIGNLELGHHYTGPRHILQIP